MAYSDEWWKGKYGQADKKHLLCPENDPAVHSHCGYTNANHPDGYANEEWWGIMRTVKNEGQPDLMQPRKIYDVLRSLWGNQTFLPLASR